LIPGAEVRLTLVQFSGIAAAPVRQRLQDPGSVKLVVRVRDMDAAFSRVRNHVERVYTEGGMPIKPEGPAAVNTAVIMRDPDGYPLEFALQGTPPIAADVPAGSNIVGGWGHIHRRRRGRDPSRSIAPSSISSGQRAASTDPGSVDPARDAHGHRL
jgi:hypothetical protein